MGVELVRPGPVNKRKKGDVKQDKDCEMVTGQISGGGPSEPKEGLSDFILSVMKNPSGSE